MKKLHFGLYLGLVGATLTQPVIARGATEAANMMITGAGATFPYPLYSKWFSDYRTKDASVQFNYQSIGSGGGIRQLLDKTVDFGASDAPMTDEQLNKSAVPIIHIPTVLGAVVLSYNLKGVARDLQLSPSVVAKIFLGEIKKWNDPAILASNKGLTLPDQDILVVHRSDGSGTTAIFSDFLSKVSPDWSSKVGSGTALKWPSGLGGKGNEGVSGLIKQTDGSIGYVELIYAESNQLPTAKIQNKAGSFVKASSASVTSAAQGALKAMPADFRVSITNADGKASYPIAGFTYLLLYQKMDKVKGKKMVEFLNWAIHQGQKQISPLTYAPLPKPLIPRIEKRIKEFSLN